MMTSSQAAALLAEVSELRRRISDLENDTDETISPAPVTRKAPAKMRGPNPRFWVLHTEPIVPVGDTVNALTFSVLPGSWWREGKEYILARTSVSVTPWATGKYYVVVTIAPNSDPPPPEYVLTAELLDETAFLALTTSPSDYRVIAIVHATGGTGEEQGRVWQRWYSDIYDGGLSEPADWDRDGDVYEDTGAYYLDVTKGHLHIHGRGLYELTATTQVEVQEGGYVYLEFDTTANSLAVRFETNFPESTDELYNFLLYKIEGFKVVRDLRTAFNFGSPI